MDSLWPSQRTPNAGLGEPDPGPAPPVLAGASPFVTPGAPAADDSGWPTPGPGPGAAATPAPPPTRPPAGHGSQRHLGPFELLGELGRGGMGVVHRARDPEGREVALKVLLHGVDTNPQRLERFRREAVLTAALEHPGIVRALNAGVAAGRPWVAFELVDGARTLAEVLPLVPVRRRVELIRDAARALGAAHQRGVVHRDVKPANILVDPAGRVRVTDFGLAAARGLAPLTQTGSLVGTPLWMSPEQADARKELLGPPSDVWALGVILYEALTGELPFQSASFVGLVDAIRRAAPRPPHQVAPAVDRQLEAVCLHALQKVPARRHADGEALAKDLDRALGARGVRADLRCSDAVPARSPRRALFGVHVALGSAGVALLLALVALRGGPSAEQLVARGRSLEARDPVAARAAYEQAARRGQVQAMAPLARMVAEGRGGAADRAQAQVWWLRAADAGDATALADLARRDEAAGDPTAALAWWRRAATAGDAGAMVALGVRLRDGQGADPDPAEAATWLRRAAERGHMGAMRALAAALAHDDPGLAADWLRRAAERDDAEAMVRLAGLLEANSELADAQGPVAWARRAAAAGHPEGMFLLSERLTRGQGVARDEAQATTWLERAAQAGHGPACAGLAARLQATDPAAAAGWLRRGAGRGDPACMHALGRAHLDGLGVAQDVGAGLAWLLRAAALGQGGAAARVGELFERGEGLPQDDRRAREWFGRAADLGDAAGLASLGAFLIQGKGGPRDPAQAVSLLLRAAAAGQVRAMADLGRAYERGEGAAKDRVQALAWYRKAAEGGDARSMLRVATLLEAEAAGRAEVIAEAADWYRRAAELGDPTGMNNWAHALSTGEGVARDDAKAVEWYRRAAEAGLATSMVNYALFLRDGRGAPPDRQEALRWARRAAEANAQDARAQQLVAELQGGTRVVVSTAALRRAAEAGDAAAALALGLALRAVEGAERDPAAAEGWLRRALDGGKAAALTPLVGLLLERGARDEAIALLQRGADQGDAAAMTQLGQLLATAEGEARDEARAAALWRRAADQGDAAAMTHLARLLLTGRGLERDPGQAAMWLRRAVDAGHAEGMVSLADLLVGGRGVPRDLQEAVRLYSAAAEKGEAAGMTGLGRLLLRGATPQGWIEGVRWLNRAVAAKHGPGMVELAWAVVKGRGTRRSVGTALRLLQRALAAGEGEAVLRLARLLDDTGRPAQARGLWQALADQGEPRAMLQLARLLASGRGGPADEAAARAWREKSAAAGLPAALVALARDADHDPQADPTAALELWRRAAAGGQSDAMVELARLTRDRDAPGARAWLERAAALGDAEAALLLKASAP